MFKVIMLMFLLQVTFSMEKSGLIHKKINLELTDVSQYHDVIGQGMDMLQSLLKTSSSTLDFVKVSNTDLIGDLGKRLVQVSQKIQEQEDGCLDIENNLALMREEFELNAEQINWYNKRMASNSDRITTLQQIRCNTNIEWLNFLRSGFMTIKVVQFMRTSVSSFNSFAQIKNFMPALEMIQSETEMNIQPILAQIKQELNEVPSDDSILTNWQVVSSSKNIPAVKQQLIDLLTHMEQSILAKNNRSQTNEIISQMRTKDFIEGLHQENLDFKDALAHISVILGQVPEETITNQEQATEQCRQYISASVEEQGDLTEQVEQATQSDEDQESRLNHQNELLQLLIAEYSTGIQGVNEQMTTRINKFASGMNADENNSLQQKFGDLKNLDRYIDTMVKTSVKQVKAPTPKAQKESQTNELWN